MALPAWSLVSWAQFVDHMRGDIGKQDDRTFAESTIVRATRVIENRTFRRLVFRGTDTQWTDGEGYTEFHTIDRDGLWYIYTEEKPINAVSIFAEDSTGQFAPGNAFTVNTDFKIHKHEGKLVRVVGGGTNPSGFISGIDVLKAVYSAGYLSTPSRGNVPPELAEACLEVSALIWRESDRRKQGLRSESSGAPGAVSSTRFDPKKLPPHVEELIQPHVRLNMNPTFRRE